MPLVAGGIGSDGEVGVGVLRHGGPAPFRVFVRGQLFLQKRRRRASPGAGAKVSNPLRRSC